MSLRKKISSEKLPSHVAIIMDGNGRWAHQRAMDRIYGHKEGVNAVRNVIECAAEIGIKYLTLYTFSTENWNRPDEEVAALMGILVQSLSNETDTLIKNNIRLNVIGDIERLNSDVKETLLNAIKRTSNGTGLEVVVALSYSSRWEIVEAARKLAVDIEKGKLTSASIKEEDFVNYLSTNGIPDPELVIRTSGEMRISNFLLWQIAYAELYFTEVLWPDFGKEEFYKAIIDFQKRERRFGKTSEQIQEIN